MKIYFLRHGATKGNLEHRYVGITDEGLLAESKRSIKVKRMHELKIMQEAEKIFVSPRKRCVETAELLYPGKKQIVVEEFQECDFGEFEYKNYGELNGDPRYQRFIDTQGRSGFPGGENREAFQCRCVRGMERILRAEENAEKTLAVIAHGGTIMAILDQYSSPHRDYYDWQVGTAEGFLVQAEKTEGVWQFCKIRKL